MDDPQSFWAGAQSFWAGAGGDAYTQRNVVDWRSRLDGWREILAQLDGVQSVLEVGCNRGHNLRCWQDSRPSVVLYAVEPNKEAIRNFEVMGVSLLGGRLPDLHACRSNSADVVFVCGVLIHVPPVDLPRSYDELVRVSRKYVLVMEYYAREPTRVHWQGRDDLLVKRDFGGEMEARHPDLVRVATGFLGKDKGFDDVTWWLWRKL